MMSPRGNGARLLATTDNGMTALPEMDPPQRCRPEHSRWVVDCAGAQFTAYERGPGIVLGVDGEVDAANANLVAQAIGHFSQPKVPLILDVSHVDFLGVSGFRALLALGREYQPLCVVTGTALRRLMRIFPRFRFTRGGFSSQSPSTHRRAFGGQ
jgi:anti-anti-sigma regulatory factor